MKPVQTLKTLATTVALATLVGCAAQQPIAQQATSVASTLPGWVMNPVVENGIADTQCVLAKPNTSMSILKNQATTLARADLSKQIQVRVKAMDKTYQRLTDTTQGQEVGGTFESVSKQVSQQVLTGSRAIQMDYITLPGGEQNFCVMTALSPELTNTLFKQVVQKSGANLSPQHESVLYEQFMGSIAQNDLAQEIQKEFMVGNAQKELEQEQHNQ